MDFLKFVTLTHIRRFQEYFNYINILISSSTLQFLQFWYQIAVNCHFVIVKSVEVTSGFISKVLKKVAIWNHLWNIWELIVKIKISPIFVHYQGSNGCQKNWQNLKNLVWKFIVLKFSQTWQNYEVLPKISHFWWLLEVFWSFFNIGWILAQ